MALLSALAVPTAVSLAVQTATAANTASGLSVFVGYAEDKEIETPDPAAFPTPWAGSPNTVFLGGTVPGQAACGTLPTCYDTGAVRLDNTGTNPVTVSDVSVDVHSSLSGGQVFDLWGSFTVQPGTSEVLAANPPTSNPGYDNFDTSGFPSTCTPITVAPTVTLTVAGVATTLVDSTHVLDTGGIDRGTCSPKANESTQWRPIGASGANDATLTLGPTTATASQGHPVTETATLLDGGGTGLPHTPVAFTVMSGPDAGQTGNATTDGNGHAAFAYTGTGQGEDVLEAAVTTVGTFVSGSTRVLWTDGTSVGWSSADIGSPALTGGQSFDPASGTWTVQGGGADINGTADQFHYVWQSLPGDGGIGAEVTSEAATNPAAKAGVMLRATTNPGSPYYAAFVTPGTGVVVQDRSLQGGATTTVLTTAGAVPAFLWVAVSNGSASTYGSTDGYTWSLLSGSTATVNLGSSPLAGLAVTSHDNTKLGSATMGSVVVSNLPPAPPPPVSCPGNWTCADIGGPTPAGSQTYAPSSGLWTIQGGGADITGTADQFHYVWQTLQGNGGISARVVSQSVSNSQAKAGLMLRATTNPGSPDYAVVVSPGAGIKVQVRSTQGGTTTKIANPTGTVPTYLQVTWSGSTFSAFTSPDGATWTLIAGSTATVNLGSTFLAGLAVTSHNSGVLGTVTMDTVTTPGTVPTNIPQNITYTGPVSGTVGGSATLTATGGGSGNPVVFSLDTVHTTAGACTLSGTNNATVTYTGVGSCVVDANQAGNATYSAAPQVSATIVVGGANQAPQITSPATATFVKNNFGTFTVTASGYPAPTFSETGGLDGLTLNATTGVISGIPIATGTFTVTLKAANGSGTATQTLSLTVDPAPSTTVLVPKTGANLRGTTALDASASDANGITMVQFVLTGGSYNQSVIGTATPTIYGYLFSWNTTTVPGGTYTLGSVAYTGADRGFSPGITVTVDDTPPSTAVLVPSSGAVVGATTTLDASASKADNASISKVQFVLTGGSYNKSVIGTATLTIYGYVFSWNTTTVPAGTYTLQSLATDATGISGYSPGIAVTVK